MLPVLRRSGWIFCRRIHSGESGAFARAWALEDRVERWRLSIALPVARETGTR